MKKAIKKMLALFLVGILSIGLLAGCVQTATSTPAASTSGSGEAQSAAEPELEPVELSWYFVGPGEQANTDKIEEAVNEYLKDKLNVTLQLYCLDWGTYQDKMSAKIAAGEPFDLCYTSNFLLDYNTNARNGAFLEVNDLLDQYAPQTKAMLGEDFLAGSQINGKNYGVPANKEKARTYGIVYNKTLADKYDLDMSTVKTLADLEPMLQVIKENEPGIYPFVPSTSEFAYEWSTNSQTPGVGVILPDGTVVNQFETPEYMETMKLVRKWYEEGFVAKDLVTKDRGGSLVETGAFFAWPVNLIPGYSEEWNATRQAKEKYGFEIAQIDLTEPFMCNDDLMGSLTAISKTSKNPERAMMFIEMFNTDKYLNNLINFGIEGENYTKIDDNTIKLIPDSGYSLGMAWALGNQFINYLNEVEPADKWEQFEAFNAEAKPTVDSGFIFDPEPTKTEAAACDSVIAQYYMNLVFGEVDPETTVPEFVNALKEAGADKIIADKQAQFDAWMAEKQ